jgi:hypothetical protein
LVYKLVAQGTVEEGLLELQRRKKTLAAGIYEEGGNAAAALDASNIERLSSSRWRDERNTACLLPRAVFGGPSQRETPLPHKIVWFSITKML